MARKGRELEKLVANLETLLSDTAIAVKSPDYVPDVITGRLREVDVSLRAKAGSVDLLVILEVRDRKNKDDVTWIEQLATKKADVGASKIVAVSSSGFSQTAQDTALRYGIELRTIESLTIDTIQSWFRVTHVELARHQSILHHARLVLAKETNPGIAQQVMAAMKGVDLSKEKVLIHTGTGQRANLHQAWNQIVLQKPEIFHGLTPNGKAKFLTVDASYSNPNSRFQVSASDITANIIRIVFYVELFIRISSIPVSQITQY